MASGPCVPTGWAAGSLDPDAGLDGGCTFAAIFFVDQQRNRHSGVFAAMEWCSPPSVFSFPRPHETKLVHREVCLHLNTSRRVCLMVAR